ncbi:tetraspanin-32 [Camelus ferus]|uniref:Tetraspanin-32 n=1 Tax=Camelus ferus TaxID=419612 RepID=A0A8B8TUR3_CAMFR|nr:tetraspanin-32 [Camelus ferus]
MGLWSRVRVAKCQMLVTSFFLLLLGVAVATMAALTYFEAHFAVIGHASSGRTPYETIRHWAFSAGISLAGLLTLAAVLGTAATVREARGLMAGAFLCSALVFCALVQVAFWRFHSPSQVEDAVLDTYDLVYDQAVKGSDGIWRQELVAIQDTFPRLPGRDPGALRAAAPGLPLQFLCCGKGSPYGLQGSSEADLCRGEAAARQDCLQAIVSFLGTLGVVVSTLISLGLVSTVSAMLLSAFLWFAIHSGCNLDRRGKYTLGPRAHGCRPQEPRFSGRYQQRPAAHHPSEADALRGHLGPSRQSGGPRLLQDTPLPTHRGRDAPASSHLCAGRGETKGTPHRTHAE